MALLAAGSVVAVIARDEPAGFAAPDDAASEQVYTDVEAGFRLTYPGSWTARSGERVEFFPTGGVPEGEPLSSYEGCVECGGGAHYDGPGCAQGCNGTIIEFPHVVYAAVRTYEPPPPPEPCGPDACMAGHGVDVEAEFRYEEWPDQEKAGAEIRTEATTLGGGDANRTSFSYPERPPAIGPWDDFIPRYGPGWWCSSCDLLEYWVRWRDGWVIRLTVVMGPDAAVDDTAIARRIVESLETLES